MEKTPEELEAERLAAEETARLAAEAETARLAAEAEAAKSAAKTPEQIEEEAASAAAAKTPKADWRDDRIAKLAADKAKLASELAKFQKPVAKVEGDAGEPPLTQADVERLANEKAEAISARKSFNAACNAAAQQGRKDFPDFDASVVELTKVVDRSDPEALAQYDEFLSAALETGEASKIIYTLGRDPGEYVRIAGLSPVKRAQELATLASASAQQVSNLPKPITPLQGKNAQGSEISPDDAGKADKLSSAEWHKRRAAQVAAQPSQNEMRRRQG